MSSVAEGAMSRQAASVWLQDCHQLRGAGKALVLEQ